MVFALCKRDISDTACGSHRAALPGTCWPADGMLFSVPDPFPGGGGCARPPAAGRTRGRPGMVLLPQ